MTDTKELKKAMSLNVTDGLTVTILPDSIHEFLMSTLEVAHGYGTSEYAIRTAKIRHESELIEGKHYVKGVTLCHTLPNSQPHKIYWTKRGVVRLGFFIKSKISQQFRDWAEELVLQKIEQAELLPIPVKQLLEPKRNHNRLTHERLLDIMADICKIEDKELRLSISSKLMKGGLQ